MFMKFLVLAIVPGFLIAQEAATPLVPPRIMADTSVDSHFFPHPGVVFQKSGQWLGDEHLYNLSNNLEVFVEVEKTTGLDVSIDKEKIKNIISLAFKKTLTTNYKDNPPLPFFDVTVLIAPIDKGFAVYCSGRLFEEVKLERVEFRKNEHFQAITWEKQSLLVIPKDKLMEEILVAVKDIADAFVERYRYFEEIKLKSR